MFAEAARGELPEFPTIELYQHTGVDASLQVSLSQITICAVLLCSAQPCCVCCLAQPSLACRSQASLSTQKAGVIERLLPWQDAAGHHSSALFVGPVPWQPKGSCWGAELDGYVRHLLSICDRFAPGAHPAVFDVGFHMAMLAAGQVQWLGTISAFCSSSPRRACLGGRGGPHGPSSIINHSSC